MFPEATPQFLRDRHLQKSLEEVYTIEESGGQSLAPHQIEPHPYAPLLAELLPGEIITVEESEEDLDIEEIFDPLDYFMDWRIIMKF